MKRCCKKLTEETDNGYMLDFDENGKLSFYSDGGHGGIIEIEYYPFCGTHIKKLDLDIKLEKVY